MRLIAVLTGFALLANAQDTLAKLNIVVVEGEGSINNIRQRTAREPIVEVQDENHKPVAGAAVLFALPDSGASGSFAGGLHTITVLSDSQGRAVARGFRPNHVTGRFQIKVTATSQGRTAITAIAQSNAVGAAAAATVAGISVKLITIIAISAAAAAGGIVAGVKATQGHSGTTITPGTGTVGAPH